VSRLTPDRRRVLVTITESLVTTEEETLKLAAYLRTSRNGGTDSDALPAQLDACREWAKSEGHRIAESFEDDGASGGLPVDERPGLLAAIASVEEGRADGLVVHRLDRLARELHVQEAALARLWGAGEDRRVFEAVEGEVKRDDPDDPHRRFLRQVMGAAAELERGLIRARLSRGRRRKAERGGWVGGHRIHRRYGYKLVPGSDGGFEYEPVPDEQEVIATIRSLREGGGSLRAVGKELEGRGIPGPTGAGWAAPTLHRILKREATP
jgi:DNA invertase Pin-like site-specific DNA recombinase